MCGTVRARTVRLLALRFPGGCPTSGGGDATAAAAAGGPAFVPVVRVSSPAAPGSLSFITHFTSRREVTQSAGTSRQSTGSESIEEARAGPCAGCWSWLAPCGAAKEANSCFSVAGGDRGDLLLDLRSSPLILCEDFKVRISLSLTASRCLTHCYLRLDLCSSCFPVITSGRFVSWHDGELSLLPHFSLPPLPLSLTHLSLSYTHTHTHTGGAFQWHATISNPIG